MRIVRRMRWLVCDGCVILRFCCFAAVPDAAKSLLDTTGVYKYASWKVQGIFAIVYFGGLLLALPFMRLPPPNVSAPHCHHSGPPRSSAMQSVGAIIDDDHFACQRVCSTSTSTSRR